jgi:hypothetical protein
VGTMSVSGNAGFPSSNGFRSAQRRLPSEGQDSEISLVRTSNKVPSTWYTDDNTNNETMPGAVANGTGDSQ